MSNQLICNIYGWLPKAAQDKLIYSQYSSGSETLLVRAVLARRATKGLGGGMFSLLDSIRGRLAAFGQRTPPNHTILKTHDSWQSSYE